MKIDLENRSFELPIFLSSEIVVPRHPRSRSPTVQSIDRIKSIKSGLLCFVQEENGVGRWRGTKFFYRLKELIPHINSYNNKWVHRTST